ncbi:MAG TPA: hypothetical protein DCZ56_00550 [Sutterella sp.]|nr:hypothetical protein [Sutterella sp.]
MIKRSVAALSGAFLCLALGGCAFFQDTPQESQAEPTAKAGASRLQAYELDGGRFLAAPPTTFSSEQKADEEALLSTLSLREMDVGKKAAADMDLDVFWRLMDRYSSVTGRTLTPKALPETHELLMSTWVAARRAARAADSRYPRKRPWVDFLPSDETCRPDLKARAGAKNSYASSFVTRVWSVALALAAILPNRADALIVEAVSITNSRWICGLGWKSDIEAGRVLGAVVYSRLSSEPDYQEQMRKARAELQGGVKQYQATR